jgi:hypothetical protein
LLQGSASKSSGNGSDEDSDSESGNKVDLSSLTEDSEDGMVNNKELKNEVS